MTIQFCGGAQRVTGSKHLVRSPSGLNILLDCGLFQGINTSDLNLNFGFEPKDVDVLFLSHAHIDHSGLIPRLVKLGFSGKIFATGATRALCEVMLLDSAKIQTRDLERVNERRKKRGEELLEILYEEKDVYDALELFETISLNQTFFLDEFTKVSYYNAGHILGSAGIFIEFSEGKESTKLFFTGDIGRPNDKILASPEPFPQADYIICESTYGNRLHNSATDMKQKLMEVVKKTCVENGGKLIIPAFAVDRTQELVFALDQLESEGLLPSIPVFVDSPLSVKATLIMKDFQEDFNESIRKYIKKDGDAFGFKNLHYITDVNDSKKLNDRQEACIIISSSGMAEAGRIKHHLANNIENPKNTVLIVGYCSPNSLGAQLKNGEAIVRIFGQEKIVRAAVEVMDSFSAHADYHEMIAHLSCQDKEKVKSIFLVHGEIETQSFFKEKLLESGFKNVSIPAHLEIVSI
jgi:metallo-beta-lactamase family protein